MGFSTFSGPLRAGTIRHGATRNTGVAVLAQEYVSGDLTGTEVGNVDTLVGYIPQGARIVDIVVDQTVAAGTGTMTVSVGTASGGAQLMAAIATSAGGRFRGTATAATQLAWTSAAASADAAVYVRVAVGTGTLSAGACTVTIMYVQRSAAGSMNPTGTES